MPRKISIKCVNGSRFDYTFDNGEEMPLEEALSKPFFSITAKNGRVVFNVRNIVSVTEMETEDAEKT